MTDPADGKFATITDVTGRFEGAFPDAQLTWVSTRIGDVEGELMFQVPSLRKDVDEITTESAAAGDPGRLARVAALVANKVLDLYRNPEGVTQLARTMPDITTSRSYATDPNRGKVAFTDAELCSVRLQKSRTKFGTITVAPPHYTTRGVFGGYSF